MSSARAQSVLGKRGACLAALALLAVACASGPRPAATASAPPADAQMSGDAPSNAGSTPPAAPYGTSAAAQPEDTDPAATQQRPTAPPPPPTHGPSTAPVPGTTARPPTPDTQRSWALATLGDSERQIEATVKECTTACRALASMERAAKTLCDLGERDECTRAKARVEAARDKVRKSCGKCENGPSLVPGAPIPSAP